MQQHWLTRPPTIRLLWIVFVIVLAITVLAEFFVQRHPHFTVDQLPGFNAIYGFLSCTALIVFAKLLGFALKRVDTYYSEGRNE